ncbi:MAG: chromate efflux transporter [Gemmatimonadetes bacterium]|nr:chromate efflux transporter [Gemmatimonadota bacterium]
MWALAALFLKLGTVGFGGPAAHIAMMEAEVVAKRRWLSRQHFLDLVGATNLIPGPNSTEMAIHVGLLRAGWMGLIVAGMSFILPAALITLGFAAAYVRYGSLPEVSPFLEGIQPAVVAVIVGAVWRLTPAAARGPRLWVVGLGVMTAALAGMNEILALLGGGVLGAAWLAGGRGSEFEQRDGQGGTGGGGAGVVGIAVGGLGATQLAVAGAAAGAGISLGSLGLFFLKVGAVLYGSGYVLVSLIEGELVTGRGWLTQQQLLDAVAVGQVTPGPVLTTATFIGYVLAGLPGAVVATGGVFLPSFVFVAGLKPVLPRLRRSALAAVFLDAVNVSAVGLIAAVALTLGRATLTSWPAALIALTGTLLSTWRRVSPVYVILGGALVGWVLGLTA